MDERWKVIDGHPCYSVSNTGKVYSHKCNRILTNRLNSTGYHRVTIDKKLMLVHRLVAIAFVDGHTDERDVVNHKDFNPLNNNASNLEWTTPYGNYLYSFNRGRFTHTKEWNQNISKTKTEKMGKPVKAVDITGEVKFYESVNAVKIDGHLPGMVCKCCKGERKTHHNLKWEYADG